MVIVGVVFGKAFHKLAAFTVSTDTVRVHLFRGTFWTQGLPEGVLSNHLRGVSVCPSLNYFFLVFCMKLRHHKGTKVTRARFLKKNLGSHKWEKNILGAFLRFFAHISASSY